MRLWAVLLLALSAGALAADESCMARCEIGFDSNKTCQCDSLCKYYKSCCSDFEVTCGMITRGDTFEIAEDDEYERFGLPTAIPGPPAKYTNTVYDIGRQFSPTVSPLLDATRTPEPESTPLEMSEPTQVSKDDTVTQEVPHTDQVEQQDPGSTEAPADDNAPVATTDPPTTTEEPTTTEPPPTLPPDPDAVTCSGRPFDSFMQLKNGSLYAFRGEYFFELDQKSVLPGYPKLIKDVWGMSGPIDAAFTRVNCLGQTYIFKGYKYWRYEDGVLDEDYPRDISVGFDKIPDHVDAAFALPASNHRGKEKVFFFKGDQYYIYEFMHQPSHHECVTMSGSSPSTLFRRYTDLYNYDYERFFSELFSDIPQHSDKHRFINKDWKGLKAPLDAAMAGRIYVTPARPLPSRDDLRWYQQYGQQWDQQYGRPWDQYYGQGWGRRRRRRGVPFWGSIAEQHMNMGQEFAERGMEMGLSMAERGRELGLSMAERGREIGLRMEERGREFGRRMEERRREMEDRLRRDWDRDRRRDGYRPDSRLFYDPRDDRAFLESNLPSQSIYFFKRDKYYRVDLKTKRVERTQPPYPRSIARYWLGCSDTTGAEKK